jgi:hypothetical protein
LTGETEKTLQIDCHSSFSHITYIGDYIFWIEGSLLKWTPIYAKDIQAAVIQELLKSVPEVDEFDTSQISIHGQHNSLVITAEYEEDEFATTQVASALVHIENDGKSLLFKKYFGSHVRII